MKNAAASRFNFGRGFGDSSSTWMILFTFFVVLMIISGWSIRGEYFISAEYGLGYLLGLVGGVLMLLLLVYPLKKRYPRSSWFLLSTPVWFKLHMILGIVGPLFILYHCNFGLGSTNSNVALFCMILMVASGLIGRFIYSKIHYGLFGKRIQLKELLQDRSLIRTELSTIGKDLDLEVSDRIVDYLMAYESTLNSQAGVLKKLYRFSVISISSIIHAYQLKMSLYNDQENNIKFKRLTKKQQKSEIDRVYIKIKKYFYVVRKISELNFYERVFSLWHMLHLPIFFMLIITGFVHVYAVHVY